MVYANIITSIGTLTAELYYIDAPVTVNNFIKLSQEGFYQDMKFFSCIPNIRVITGCQNNDGSGISPFIKSETYGGCQYHDRGILSTVTRKKNEVGSQFMICLNRRDNASMDYANTCFGKIIHGDNLLNIINTDTILESILIDDRRTKSFSFNF